MVILKAAVGPGGAERLHLPESLVFGNLFHISSLVLVSTSLLTVLQYNILLCKTVTFVWTNSLKQCKYPVSQHLLPVYDPWELLPEAGALVQNGDLCDL